MQRLVFRLLAIVAGLMVVSWAPPTAASAAADEVQYAVQGHEFEGCECRSVCPCVFSQDTTYGDCRAITVWTVNRGQCNGVDLSGVSFVLVCTRSGKNMEKEMGNWEGVLYVSDQASEAQRKAVAEVVQAEVGPAFDRLTQKTAPITIRRDGDRHELVLGEIATLRIHGIKAANGKVTAIVDPPSPVSLPMAYCAIADVNRYDDGQAEWSFTGRNGFFGDFEFTSKKE